MTVALHVRRVSLGLDQECDTDLISVKAAACIAYMGIATQVANGRNLSIGVI